MLNGQKIAILLAVTDLRYTANSDLGRNHGIDLLIKRSEDNGKNFPEKKIFPIRFSGLTPHG